MVQINKDTWAKQNLDGMDAQTRWRYYDRLKKWLPQIFDFLTFLVREHPKLVDRRILLGLAQEGYGENFRVVVVKKEGWRRLANRV